MEREHEEEPRRNPERSNRTTSSGSGSDQEEEEEREDPRTTNNLFFQYLLRSMQLEGTAINNTNEDLIKSLKNRKVLQVKEVEEALLAIPRGCFVTPDLKDEAYEDHPLRVASMGFNISAPHMYAMCLENLALAPGHFFLDIGSGCGHFTALGGFLVGKEGKAVGLEIRHDIMEFAKENVTRFNKENKNGVELSNVQFELRNCFLPDAEERLFDRIHVGACCPSAQLDHLCSLLAEGGILVTPLEDKLVKITKEEGGKLKTEKLVSVRYGDLIVPSDAEIKEAQLAIERKRATTVTVPPDTFKEDFASLCNSEKFSDVTFLVEGKIVHAHKLVLNVRSLYFRTMLNSGMRESQMGAPIEIPEFSHTTFLTMMKFIYSGDVDPNEENAVDLLEAANYFKLERMKCLCEEFLYQTLDVENVCYLLQVGQRFDAKQLRSVCFEFIIEHYAEITLSPKFMELEKDVIVSITQEVCKRLATTNKPLSPPIPGKASTAKSSTTTVTSTTTATTSPSKSSKKSPQ